jgi:hypothetical protein
MRTSKPLAAIVLTGALAAGCHSSSGTARDDVAALAPTVVAAAVRDNYGGSCPPSTERAPSFQAIISVAGGPVTVTYQWLTGSGTSADPILKTIEFPYDGPQHAAISLTETGYLPDQTRSDWIAVYLRGPVRAESNHITFTTSCYIGRPHRLEPREPGTPTRPVY